MLTQSRLKTLLNYDQDTGIFTWRVRTCRNVMAGDVAGTTSIQGYRQIRINRRTFAAHRLAWLYVHGIWPADQIDHINGVRDDNRLVNLREATSAQNHQNRKKSANNTSGFTGVSWNCWTRKWQAAICAGGQRSHLGHFDTPESAHTAYLAAKAELHTFNQTVRS